MQGLKNTLRAREETITENKAEMLTGNELLVSATVRIKKLEAELLAVTARANLLDQTARGGGLSISVEEGIGRRRGSSSPCRSPSSGRRGSATSPKAGGGAGAKVGGLMRSKTMASPGAVAKAALA